MQDAVDKATEAEGLAAYGNYAEAQKAAADLIQIVDRVDVEAIDPKGLTGIREGARSLGKALAHLPLPFGEPTVKLRYTDLPPITREMIDNLMTRVEERIGQDDATKAMQLINSFISGGRMFSQAELSSQLAKMLRLLT